MELRHKYLNPADLGRLRFVTFASRRPVEGLYAGRHRSPQRGHSIEFVDYRQYQPGDEVADIDWKVYGRSDRLVIKLFQQTTDMTVHLLLDASASMDYAGSDGRSKYDHAARIAAAIAFLITRQQDKFSFAIARHGLRHFHPPAGSRPHLQAALDAMEKTQLGETADLARAVEQVTAKLGRRGVLIVISDLLDEPEPVLAALSAFNARGGESILFHTLHADELDLPRLDAALFRDAESGRTLGLNLDDIRPAYRRRMDRFINDWRSACKTRGIDHNLTTTAESPFEALERYLLTRT